jgi:16S rRNA (guanine527-N7)-methyltransferase
MRASLRLALRERLDQGLAQLGDPLAAPPAEPNGTSLGHAAAELSDAQRNALLDYIDLLAHWNSRYNLTAVRDPLEMIGRHLLDSLAALSAFDASPVLDFGTGAGLPGIPLAIARPELQFVLLDSIGKKTRFVRQAAASLELGNVCVVQARFESYQPEQKFATITARALAPLDALWSGSAHLRQPDGALLAYKGRRPDDEIAALSAIGAKTGTTAEATTGTTMGARVTVTRLEVPFVPGERHLIRIDGSP